jgi:hypothetical protein
VIKSVSETVNKIGVFIDISVPDWLRKKHDVFDDARFPSPEKVQLRLDILLGTKIIYGRRRAGAVVEILPQLSFAERERLLETARNLFPSLNRLTGIEIDETKTDGRLILLCSTGERLYLHPILFKAGFPEGKATVCTLVLASAFAATLTGTVGQGALATLYFLPFLIKQICSDPHLHSKQVARTFDLLESAGWDVSPLSKYWREVSDTWNEKSKPEYVLARRGLYALNLSYSFGDGESFIYKNDSVQLSPRLVGRLQRITGMGSRKLTDVLVDVGIYQTRENKSVSSDFYLEWPKYVERLLGWFHLPDSDSVTIAVDIVTEGMKSVSFPLRDYVMRLSGETETSLREVEKLKWSWPTEREESMFISQRFGNVVDAHLKKLMIMASRSLRNVSLGDLFDFHTVKELKEWSLRPAAGADGASRMDDENLLRAYERLPVALCFLGRDCCKSLVDSLNVRERISTFLPLIGLPIDHEGLEWEFKKRAVLFERLFTGQLVQDLSEVADSLPFLDLLLQRIVAFVVGAKGSVAALTPTPPLTVYYCALERFGFLVTDTNSLVARFGARAGCAVSKSAINALDSSQDPVVRRCAYKALELYADDVDAMKGVSIALIEIENAPVVISDAVQGLKLEAAARCVAAKGTSDSIGRFFGICDEKRAGVGVASYLIGAFCKIFVSRGDIRALIELITACEKGAEIGDSTWALVLKCDAARRVFNGLGLDSTRFFLTHSSISKQNRALARSLIGEEKIREVLSSVDSSVRQRSMEGASDSEVRSLFGSDEDIHNQRALFARRAYVESSRLSQKWVKDLFLNERKLNYYAVLGLPFGANPEQVKFSYRLLAASFHSDRVVDKEDKSVADRQMREINEAYAVLSKDEKRVPYDEMIVRNRLEARPNILPVNPWYTASSLKHLHLQPPPSTFYKAQCDVGRPQVVSQRLLG